MPNEHIRAWIYRVMLAALTVAAVYGIVSEDEVTAWTGLIVALVGNGLAAANTTLRRG